MDQQILEGRPGRYWHRLEDGRIQCDLCPRYCKLHEGQRGLCFVRGRRDDQIVLTTYNNRTYRVDDIDFTANVSNSFTGKDGAAMTYVDETIEGDGLFRKIGWIERICDQVVPW